MPHPLFSALPETLSEPLRALRFDRDGDWKAAHEAAQAGDDRDSAWVHAYLHRKGGNQWNAEYWYRRAGQPVYLGSLEEEWTYIANALYRERR